MSHLRDRKYTVKNMRYVSLKKISPPNYLGNRLRDLFFSNHATFPIFFQFIFSSDLGIESFSVLMCFPPLSLPPKSCIKTHFH